MDYLATVTPLTIAADPTTSVQLFVAGSLQGALTSSAPAFVPLHVGSNTVSVSANLRVLLNTRDLQIVVTAQWTAITKTYSINIVRSEKYLNRFFWTECLCAPFADACPIAWLTKLTPSIGRFSPTFNPEIYTVRVFHLHLLLQSIVRSIRWR